MPSRQSLWVCQNLVTDVIMLLRFGLPRNTPSPIMAKLDITAHLFPWGTQTLCVRVTMLHYDLIYRITLYFIPAQPPTQPFTSSSFTLAGEKGRRDGNGLC